MHTLETEKNKPLVFVSNSSHESYFHLLLFVLFGKKLRLLYFSSGAGVAQSVQCLTTGWTTGRSGLDPRRGQRIFPLASVFRPALRPTQSPVQWVLGVISLGVKRVQGVLLTTHPI
jgi:hypothetical protein